MGLKALALIIAVGLWVAGHRDIERAVEVPLEFRNIPADLMVLDNRVDYVVLRVMGPRTSVSTLDADNLKLSLDLDGAKSGLLSYPLAANDFNVPRGVTVARITPPVVHLRLEPVAKRTLPVSVRLSGKPMTGYRIAQTTVRPESVAVQGPAEEVRRMATVETVPVDVEEGRGGIKRRVRLSNDGKPLSIVPDQVEVVVTIEEEQASRAFERIEVHAKDFKGVYNVAPSVGLCARGRSEKRDRKIEVDFRRSLSKPKRAAGAANIRCPSTLNLPADVQVVEQKPQRFRVRIIKPAE